jgi:hypothetical protein
VRVEGRKTLVQGGIASPQVGPESRRFSIANGDLGDGAKDLEAGSNVLPDGGVSRWCTSPRSRELFQPYCRRNQEAQGAVVSE